MKNHPLDSVIDDFYQNEKRLGRYCFSTNRLNFERSNF